MLMFTMDNMGTFNALKAFESQILNYKQDTESENLCFVIKV